MELKTKTCWCFVWVRYKEGFMNRTLFGGKTSWGLDFFFLTLHGHVFFSLPWLWERTKCFLRSIFTDSDLIDHYWRFFDIFFCFFGPTVVKPSGRSQRILLKCFSSVLFWILDEETSGFAFSPFLWRCVESLHLFLAWHRFLFLAFPHFLIKLFCTAGGEGEGSRPCLSCQVVIEVFVLKCWF